MLQKFQHILQDVLEFADKQIVYSGIFWELASIQNDLLHTEMQIKGRIWKLIITCGMVLVRTNSVTENRVKLALSTSM